MRSLGVDCLPVRAVISHWIKYLSAAVTAVTMDTVLTAAPGATEARKVVSRLGDAFLQPRLMIHAAKQYRWRRRS
jgi:hypothetical protein